ncbi:MAG: hypothetical protein EZS28_022260 [Streblomastix strix]|uniref:Uncharacterized protein n=1 Tax=Streblomastix strix TaxID=222440 RepID=A0A5J4VHV0_9EUKA|nr:MAG: hypothetical protein EZS28_022260 [Streblomastix strix]
MNTQIQGRSVNPTLGQRMVKGVNIYNNGNSGCILVDISLINARIRTKTTDQHLRMVFGLEIDVRKKMIDLRKQELCYQLRRFISLTERQVSIKIKYLASIIDKLNFLRVQVREASLYLKLMDSAKTRALKNKEWKENMILPKEILQVLYWWQGVIVRNIEMTFEVKIPEAVMVSDASPKGWGVTLELQIGDTLVQHGEWNKEQKRWTSNKKEIEAIFLGLFRYGQVFKELQIKAILIKSDSSTAVQDLAKHRAEQTLVAEVKKIVKIKINADIANLLSRYP